jgi:hypothetical protein
MKNIILTIVLTFVFLLNGFAQRRIEKSLFFYQDSVSFLGCGVIHSVDILYFVSDTSRSHSKNFEYYIAIECAETYGEDFFRKGHKYKLFLNKNFKGIRPFMPPSTFKKFIKQKNFFVAHAVKPRR